MNTDEDQLNELTEKIIGLAFKIHNALGGGFAEKVYENALLLELLEAGLHAVQQMPIVVHHRGTVGGEFYADVVVERTVLIELKAVRNFDDGHTAQCLNYLAATNFVVCLLLNFGRKVEVKRFRGRQVTKMP